MNHREAAAATPAIACNRFSITVTDDTTRIAFAEQDGDVPHYRTAVMLSNADAAHLALLITSLQEARADNKPRVE